MQTYMKKPPKMSNILQDLNNFFNIGGIVLYSLLLLMIIILTLIIDRYIYLFTKYKNTKKNVLVNWNSSSKSRDHKYIRQLLLNQVSIEIHGSVPLLRYLLGLAPLLGLLGTVTGMIAVFDAMGTFGTSNVRPIAAGISQATIPTMTGMIIAIIGLWFDHNLHGKIHLELRKLKDEMT